jgi:hypothetical protein
MSGPGIVATSGRKTAGKITSGGAVRASKIVTITTTTAHGLGQGQQVLISDVPDKSFNGRFAIKQVPSSTTFTYFQNAVDATSGPGAVSTPGGCSYKRSAVFQVLDQAFVQPSTAGASLRSGKAPTSDVTLDMWTEVMNEAEQDVKDEAKDKARASRQASQGLGQNRSSRLAAVSAKNRNKLANGLLIMHRQLDPDFYPEPNTPRRLHRPQRQLVSPGPPSSVWSQKRYRRVTYSRRQINWAPAALPAMARFLESAATMNQIHVIWG